MLTGPLEPGLQDLGLNGSPSKIALLKKLTNGD